MNDGALKPKAVVLLSGGLDSTTCLALAIEQGFSTYTLAFDYGQRHDRELEMAAWQAEAQGSLEHIVVSLDMRKIGRSALTADIEVPKHEEQGIPATYVPARNAVFLSLGLAWAEVLRAPNLFIGVNQVDFSGYPDCRKDFIEAFERMANLATRMGTEGERVRIHTPLLELDKADIVRSAIRLGVDLSQTHTCYDPSPEGLSCGTCPSCRLRLKGFEEAQVQDPIPYESNL